MDNLYGWINVRIYKDSRGVEIKYDNDPGKIIPILGALEIAKQLVFKNTKIISAKEEEKKEPVMMGKDDAIKIYLDLGQKIQNRLLTMQKSNDNSKFDISPDLLSIV